MLDDGLIEAARGAQGRLIDAEHAAELARSDFHRAVRRLQLGGASMRELASALGLSHQRVHQIVEAAGGSRRWRRHPADVGEGRFCSLCGRQKGDAKRLVAGPGVSICDLCVALVAGVQASGEATHTPLATVEPVTKGATGRCSFCGKFRRQVAGLTVARGTAGDSEGRKWAGDVHICSKCLALCGEILEQNLR